MSIHIDEINRTEIILIFYIEQLLCCILITSTQFSPRTVSEQLNEDNRKQALFENSPSIGFMLMPRSRNIHHASIDWVLYRINIVT